MPISDNELVAAVDPHEIAVRRDPTIVVNEAVQVARVLKDLISRKQNPVMFNGEQYLEFEDWQTVGQFYGYSVKTGEAEEVDIDGIKGAKAKAELVDKYGNVVGGATAFCLRDEPNWRTKPFFQLASMAQTRSGSKALRNRFSWVPALAGIKTKAADEVETVAETHAPHQTKETLPTGTMIAEIKDWLFTITKGDQEKTDALMKDLTKWKTKDTKEEKWLTLTDLPRIAKSKPEWLERIHGKAQEMYNALAGSAQELI